MSTVFGLSTLVGEVSALVRSLDKLASGEVVLQVSTSVSGGKRYQVVKPGEK